MFGTFVAYLYAKITGDWTCFGAGQIDGSKTLRLRSGYKHGRDEGAHACFRCFRGSKGAFSGEESRNRENANK